MHIAYRFLTAGSDFGAREAVVWIWVGAARSCLMSLLPRSVWVRCKEMTLRQQGTTRVISRNLEWVCLQVFDGFRGVWICLEFYFTLFITLHYFLHLETQWKILTETSGFAFKLYQISSGFGDREDTSKHSNVCQNREKVYKRRQLL